MYHPWTLMLMLHITQSIYLVLPNVLSTSFLMFTLHSMKSAQHCTILVDVLDTCGAMIWSYFGIALLPFFVNIENAVYTFFQNRKLLNLSMIEGFHCLVMFSLSLSEIGWILFSNASSLQKMLARKCPYRGKHMKDWK